MSYWTGFLEGFRKRGEEVYQQNVKQDADRRQMEGAVFTHLLQSRDPQIRALALQGIYEGAQPSRRKKGWSGFLGEIQQSSVFPQIQALAGELVPDEPPSPPGAPQSAAMSTNVPVQQPSTPMQITTSPTGQETISNVPAAPRLEDAMPSAQMAAAAPQGPPAAPQMEEDPLMPGAPAPPPMRPRGTQVPTAEDIARMQARVPLETRIGMAEQYLDEESAKKAIMGILGAPQTTRQFGAPTFAVIDPMNNEPVPVAFDYSSGAFFFTDGTRVPRGAKFVQMSRAGQGSGLTSYVEDNPQQRAQLQAAYPEMQLPPGPSPTGFLKIQVRPDGTAMAIPSEFTPPPAFSGTATVLEEGSGVPVRTGVPRGGGKPVLLGDEPRTEVAKIQQQAQGLLSSVDKLLAQEQVGPGGLRRRVPQARMDALVLQEAKKLGLPYQTYSELQQAAKVSPDITPRQERTDPNAGMSTADRVRAAAVKDLQGGVVPEPKGLTPPAGPPIRSSGAGPRK